MVVDTVMMQAQAHFLYKAKAKPAMVSIFVFDEHSATALL